MSVLGLRSKVDFGKNGTLAEVYLGENCAGFGGLKVELPGAQIESLIKLLARRGVYVIPEYFDKYLQIDIPFQSFWYQFQNPLLVGNYIDADSDDTWGLYHNVMRLRGDGARCPHSYRLTVASRSLTQEGVENELHRERHRIDLSRFSHRAEVIAAATYVDAMVTYIVRDLSLVNPQNSNWDVTFAHKIKACRNHGLLQAEVCELLHELRELRNNAAHEFSEDWRIENGPFKTVSVPQGSEEFLASLRKFVEKAELRYGEVDANSQRFYRAVELLAGELNLVAGLDNVMVLGGHHPDELDLYFY